MMCPRALAPGPPPGKLEQAVTPGTPCTARPVRQKQPQLLKWLSKRWLKSISVQLKAEQDGFAARLCCACDSPRGCSVPGILGKNRQIFAVPVPALAKSPMYSIPHGPCSTKGAAPIPSTALALHPPVLRAQGHRNAQLRT